MLQHKDNIIEGLQADLFKTRNALRLERQERAKLEEGISRYRRMHVAVESRGIQTEDDVQDDQEFVQLKQELLDVQNEMKELLKEVEGRSTSRRSNGDKPPSPKVPNGCTDDGTKYSPQIGNKEALGGAVLTYFDQIVDQNVNARLCLTMALTSSFSFSQTWSTVWSQRFPLTIH